MSASGSNGLMIDSNFANLSSVDEAMRKHERRLASAMHLDLARRTLPINDPLERMRQAGRASSGQYDWRNSSWEQDHGSIVKPTSRLSIRKPEKAVPTTAFRVLDAPRLKDDYYCSVLAYCRTLQTLAVALAHRVYLWTEKFGVRHPPLLPVRPTDYVTSLAFSSETGGKAILAIARYSGHITLWSLLERRARFDIPHPSTACSVAFRPINAERVSLNTGCVTKCEDLLVGDDSGRIYYYSVEWPNECPGMVTLLANIEAHSQNVCGLAWAPHGETFVSGGNDNKALLYHVEDIDRVAVKSKSAVEPFVRTSSTPRPGPRTYTLPSAESQVNNHHDDSTSPETDEQLSREITHLRPPGGSALRPIRNLDGSRSREADRGRRLPQGGPPTPPRSPATRSLNFSVGHAARRSGNMEHAPRHIFHHAAAVKAIAFAPWQPTLVATGGGSNDRQIHFYHTDTGTTLAVINVSAQVTSLIWSSTRREIAATFGYAQPQHEIRIAVFAWPSCECVVSIPWEKRANGEVGRALWAIPYPGGPNDAAPERLQSPGTEHHVWEEHRIADPRNTHIMFENDPRRMPLTPETSPTRSTDAADGARIRRLSRGEGETWASRTEEEGSLIIACCDQTVKFFEVWAGKSKGKCRGLGSQAGVLGGSKVLEGWCHGMAIDEVGAGEDVIR